MGSRFPWGRWHRWLVLVFVVTLAGPALIVAQTRDATITDVQSKVEYSPAGSDGWRPAAASDALGIADRVRTGPGGSTRLSFLEGTTALLGPITSVRVDSRPDVHGDTHAIAITQTSGITQAQVRPVGERGAAYIVETGTVRVSAPGATCPWVRVHGDGTVLVRNYDGGSALPVPAQAVQQIAYVPVLVPGPTGPVAVPMPQLVPVLKPIPPRAGRLHLV